MRILKAAGAALLALALSAPTSAAGDSRLVKLDEALAPIHVRFVEMTSLLPQLDSELRAAVNTYRPTEIFEAAKRVKAAFTEVADIAADGLTVLDRFDPLPCFADYHAVERVGFLLLAEVSGDPQVGAAYWQKAVYLLLEYATLIRSVTDCSAEVPANAA